MSKKDSEYRRVSFFRRRRVLNKEIHRNSGASKDLMNAVRRSNLNPSDLAAIHNLLDLLHEEREVFIFTDPDLIAAIKKIRGH